MPCIGRENVRHATLLFCAEGVTVQMKPAWKEDNIMANRDVKSAELRKAFAALSNSDNDSYNLHAISIGHAAENGEISYAAHSLSIRPKEDWIAHLKEVGDGYVGSKKPIISDEFDVKPYDGTVLEENEAFVISGKDVRVKKCFNDFSDVWATESVEHGADSMNPNALAICDDEKNHVFLSVKSPFSILKHKFWCDDSDYKKISGKVLTLSTKMDVVIIGEKLYFLTIAGVQAFVSESICKSVAKDKADALAKLEYISGAENLAAVSLTGLNPRRYLGYNEGRVAELGNATKRRDIAKTFGIKYAKGKFDLSEKGDAERFIKVICNRGMVDPFTEGPVEVASSKVWKG